MHSEYIFSPVRNGPKKFPQKKFYSRFDVNRAEIILCFSLEWKNNRFVCQLWDDSCPQRRLSFQRFPLADAHSLTSVSVRGSGLLNVASFVAF